MNKSKFFQTSDGLYLYFEDKGNGIPLVFIPGFMCTTKFFEKNAEYLSQKYRVIIMDPRGQGRSSKSSGPNSLALNAKDIHELLEYLDIQNAMLIGWSLGGSIVAKYCQLYNCEYLSAIGIIDTPLYPFSDDEWNCYGCKNHNIDAYNQMIRTWYLDPQTYFENFCKKLLPDGIPLGDSSWIIDEISQTPCWCGIGLHNEYVHTDGTLLLKNVTVPAALFCADSIMYPNGTKMGHHYKKCLSVPSEVYEFYTGGHLLFLKEIDLFHQCLEMFIAKYMRGAN